MNVLFNQNNINNKIGNINTSQTKEKNNNYLAEFLNSEINKNSYYSENQRNLIKFNSQKKIRKKEIISKNKTHNDSKVNAFLLDNNILKNFSNLIAKSSKFVRNSKTAKNNNKSHYLSKPQLEIEINHINSNNASKNKSKIASSKKYKKNISEHDLINNLLTSFGNYNLPKGINNANINFNKSKNKNRTKMKRENTFDSKIKPNNNNNKNISKTRHASDTKLLRSSSGYSYINSHLSQTNSFLSGNHSNHLEYISTWGNNPDMTNSNFANMIKSPNKKKDNKSKNKKNGNKGPFIGKIIKNYKNNDLNCIFNMNLIPPVSQINNMQDYFKNLYKIEYNSEYRSKKDINKNNYDYKKYNNSNIKRSKEKEKDKETKTKSNNDDYSQSKNTMTKTNESKIKKEKDSIDNFKYCISDTPEEIHFYIINSVQNGKNMIFKLNKK